MFGLSKKKEERRKRGLLEKIVMGAIIGTAVGSVIGLTVAPKKKKAIHQIDGDVKEIGKLTKETATGLFSIAKKLMNKRKVEQEKRPEGLKKIPTETVDKTPVTSTSWMVIPGQEQEK